MQNGPKTITRTHQPRPAALFAARSKRWTSSAARPEPKGSQNAQRNYERYLALARAEALIGNTVGAEKSRAALKAAARRRTPPPACLSEQNR
jgi:hypothetical protein